MERIIERRKTSFPYRAHILREEYMSLPLLYLNYVKRDYDFHQSSGRSFKHWYVTWYKVVLVSYTTKCYNQLQM